MPRTIPTTGPAPHDPTVVVPVKYLADGGAAANVVVPFQAQSFTENANWRVFRMMAETIEGFEFLSKLHNEVSIFGSARTRPGHEQYKNARKLGFLLGKNGYTVITGGGPGIMEAANRGAFQAGGVSVGLDIELAHEQRRNKYVTRGMGFHYFFTRKVMLSISAQAYIFFPGGFGTIDEMSEMLCLIQTQKIPNNIPFILVGKTFWKPFLRWMKQAMAVDDNYINEEDMNIMHVVDTAEEAFEIIKTTKERPFN
ncbi:MAG: TIGR00730 family Rossman fold protein [Patescibacteria group bacterium]